MVFKWFLNGIFKWYLGLSSWGRLLVHQRFELKSSGWWKLRTNSASASPSSSNSRGGSGLLVIWSYLNSVDGAVKQSTKKKDTEIEFEDSRFRRNVTTQ